MKRTLADVVARRREQLGRELTADELEDVYFGQLVKRLRLNRGLTQDVLAERCTLSKDTIRRLEVGEFSPTLRTLRKLGAGLELPLSALFPD